MMRNDAKTEYTVPDDEKRRKQNLQACGAMVTIPENAVEKRDFSSASGR